jgi:DNA repair exonuclease SbcCD ATPase subunit
MTALWQRYENRQVQPTAPAPEVQARVSSLEREVAALKALLQSRDEDLAAWDLTISEEHSANARLKKEVLEVNERFLSSLIVQISYPLACRPCRTNAPKRARMP